MTGLLGVVVVPHDREHPAEDERVGAAIEQRIGVAIADADPAHQFGVGGTVDQTVQRFGEIAPAPAAARRGRTRP
ncbi:hypothetical protein ACFYT3_17170 [Nocardia amikacinitolerans]|uniref:hypothetical protein n=1 Tax=Nocardia amikacinitolerans TaxID=756689 RepID=UPI0020A48715|nr:hypothetical protein [Nocardia amikacinitolerans]